MHELSSVGADLRSARLYVLTWYTMRPKVGTISANGDEEIGKLIARAMERVGKEGVITVQVRCAVPALEDNDMHRLRLWSGPSRWSVAPTSVVPSHTALICIWVRLGFASPL